MQLALVCVHLHPLIPALVPSNALRLVGEGDDLELRMKVTPSIGQRIAQAIRDGALILNPQGPTWDEIEADVFARRDELLAALQAAVNRAAARRAEARLAG